MGFWPYVATIAVFLVALPANAQVNAIDLAVPTTTAATGTEMVVEQATTTPPSALELAGSLVTLLRATSTDTQLESQLILSLLERANKAYRLLERSEELLASEHPRKEANARTLHRFAKLEISYLNETLLAQTDLQTDGKIIGDIKVLTTPLLQLLEEPEPQEDQGFIDWFTSLFGS